MTNTEPMADVVVTQADREAAADLAAQFQRYTHMQIEAPAIRRGEHDDWEFVQAFARHRIASRPAPSEASGDVVGNQTSIISDYKYGCGHSSLAPDAPTEIKPPATQAPQADALREAVGIISDWLDYGGERGLYDSGKYLDAKIRASAFLAKQARTLTESQTDAD